MLLQQIVFEVPEFQLIPVDGVENEKADTPFDIAINGLIAYTEVSVVLDIPILYLPGDNTPGIVHEQVRFDTYTLVAIVERGADALS